VTIHFKITLSVLTYVAHFYVVSLYNFCNFVSQKVCGVWTDDDDLAEELKDVSKATEEKSWVSSISC